MTFSISYLLFFAGQISFVLALMILTFILTWIF